MNKYDLEFGPEIIEQIKCYVYRLIDPRNGETFYVGRGNGNRVFAHIRDALRPNEKDEITDKISTIRDIHIAGLQVIHVIHRHGMDEATAMEVEAALIDAYPGATNIVGGLGSSDYGPMNAKEIIDKYRAEEAVFLHKILMININKTISEKSIYDAVRFAWRINVNKARCADYIVAVKQGIIFGVFQEAEWKEANTKNFPEFNEDVQGRYGFRGKDAPSAIKDLYHGKRVPGQFRTRGAAYPIRYSWSLEAEPGRLTQSL